MVLLGRRLEQVGDKPSRQPPAVRLGADRLHAYRLEGMTISAT